MTLSFFSPFYYSLRVFVLERRNLIMKMMVNQAYENMGLGSTQTIATLFDGMARHSPEGIWFKQRAEEVGFKQAVAERDSGDPIPGSKK